MNRTDLQELSQLRLREAQLLLQHSSPSGAYYLAGYAVECALKACILKNVGRDDFPSRENNSDLYTHKLANLLGLAQLGEALTNRSKREAVFNNAWAVVVNWSEQSRYQTWHTGQASDLLRSIENTNYGVLPWLRQHW